MKRWWPREVLRFVDAWACKEGTPEDDEDAEAKLRSEQSGGVFASHDQSGSDTAVTEDMRTSQRVELGGGDLADRRGDDETGNEWVELGVWSRADEESGGRSQRRDK